MAPGITVGCVQIYSALNMNRQRPDEERLAVAPAARRYKSAPRREAAPASWISLPYAVGLLQTYVQRHAGDPARFRFLAPVIDREDPARTAERLAAADVVALSVYVWNVRHSLAVAREVKRRRPETLVVLGGPQVPDRAAAFLREHPEVDVVIHGEGEAAFLALLETSVLERSWEEVPSLTWLAPDGGLRSTPRAPRIADLQTVPSPYLEGVFDGMLRDRPEAVWMGLLETNRGCPFQCTFCDWGSAVASAVRCFDDARVRAEIEWLARQDVEYVFCCDANFGILPRDVGIAEHVAAVHRATGRPVTFVTQATKNATERSYRVQKTFAESGVQGAVTVSLQSLDPHALELVKRSNISIASFMELLRRYARDGIPTYTDMILGLPGETYDSWANGLSTLVASGQHGRIAFYSCSVLPNAEMGDPAYQRLHGMRLVSQRIIETHSSLVEADRHDVAEYLDVVVETAALPAADWRRARVFAWLLELCYYDRLVQIPWALAGALWGVRARSQVEALLNADRGRHPVLGGVLERFEQQAHAIQAGGSDLLPS
ncbi:MAG TPA: radical SAM protein, partial [Thermoanaerobaculia bacterium]|nr:radical SAM protein [Thermoanaerobaculia bacterium]